jgi:hypothetical protein
MGMQAFIKLKPEMLKKPKKVKKNMKFRKNEFFPISTQMGEKKHADHFL